MESARNSKVYSRSRRPGRLRTSEEIVSKFNTPKIKFPKILKTDPVARYFALKSGMMFKILRNSPEVGESISYRYCV